MCIVELMCIAEHNVPIKKIVKNRMWSPDFQICFVVVHQEKVLFVQGARSEPHTLVTHRSQIFWLHVTVRRSVRQNKNKRVAPLP